MTPDEATAALKLLDVTAAEADILNRLVEAQGDLVRKVDVHATRSNSAEVLISRLRKKITAAGIPVSIVALRGLGYHLVLQPKAGDA